MVNALSCDLAIVGGGLAGGLVARALVERHPDARILLIEQEQALGGNHIWSFFDGDIAERDRWIVDPLVAHRWEAGHEVCFNGRLRTLSGIYNSISSDRFDAELRGQLGDRMLTGMAVSTVEPSRIKLADGRTIKAGAVLDARGGGDLSPLSCGWQKFVGQDLHLANPHRLTRPVIMDARVPQRDGYRFVYVLPTGPASVFVEDTYYSDEADLDVPALETRIAAYARRRGWIVENIGHQEAGVLPVVMAGRFDRFWPADDPIARAGVRAGLFHPMTGYSLVEAVAFASALAQVWPMEAGALAAFSRAWARSRWRKGGYYRMLARMLFRAAPPNERHRIFERFYGLPEALIERFYAGQSTRRDKLRILCGRPPVPIRSAMRSLIDTTTR